ncbi:UDP-glucose dehydrogenase family protein [Paenibacillus nasutitermitis]|uniref:UDP-glucose 6-dehydrogenase n=1 Tax=Paenibacillus nasutitermitis TaxID=1652958 RepID=A0A916ZED2_9BACL|nr:UDP-glucose/GDP-mannose dehydrogenase family protein [Paenibacillus nasutitermitis]GGD91436.1 UDP-glucose 6-dehydrogenase [Paenibacillus nasutitermitis]
MNILIMGMGYVGVATALLLTELGWQVTGLDPNKSRIRTLSHGVLPFYEPGLDEMLRTHLASRRITFTSEIGQAIDDNEVIFLCVGTPSGSDGSADLQFIKEAAESIGKHMQGYRLIVIKSTVPVGTNEQVVQWINQAQPSAIPFDVVSNPEFLREGSALQDALEPDRIIIGSDNDQATELLRSLYKHVNGPVVVTKPKTAELIKYAANAFLASKISYMNELARLCTKMGVNIADVAVGIGMDHRIGPHFLRAGIGYGGSCFPKDIHALLFTAREHDVDLTILEKVVQVNQTQALYYMNIWEQLLGSFNGKTIAVLGISFKPDTDDIREAPAIGIISKLLENSAVIRVHDPIAKLPKSMLSKHLKQFDSVEKTVQNCDAVILCSEWKQYMTMDWEQLKRRLKQPYLFDGRNMLDGAQMTAQGYHYSGIGMSWTEIK